jgi:hypothetical protein
MKIEISCPKCNWEPDGGPYWRCTCGQRWNTFATAGKCPKCAKVWSLTQCPGPYFPEGCGTWSKHIDWYKNLGEEMRKEIEKILETEVV